MMQVRQNYLFVYIFIDSLVHLFVTLNFCISIPLYAI